MIDIATKGMFKSCCKVGGGAPPYRMYNDEKSKPVIFISNVEMTTLNSSEDIAKRINIKLRDEE